MRNVLDLSATISVPARFKLELLLPGRRFLQSTIMDHYIISNGKFKLSSQIMVFLFNDLLLFALVKSKEARRLSTSTQIFRPSPKSKKYKIIEILHLPQTSIKTKGFGSDNIIEVTSADKRMIIGMNDLNVLQEWIKTVNNLITNTKQQKSEIITTEGKKEKKSNIKTEQKSQESIKTKLDAKGEEKI